MSTWFKQISAPQSGTSTVDNFNDSLVACYLWIFVRLSTAIYFVKSSSTLFPHPDSNSNSTETTRVISLTTLLTMPYLELYQRAKALIFSFMAFIWTTLCMYFRLYEVCLKSMQFLLSMSYLVWIKLVGLLGFKGKKRAHRARVQKYHRLRQSSQ